MRTTVYEFDENGKVTKMTVTETEEAMPEPSDVPVWRYPVISPNTPVPTIYPGYPDTDLYRPQIWCSSNV